MKSRADFQTIHLQDWCVEAPGGVLWISSDMDDQNINRGKNQNPKKSPGLQIKPNKIPGPKFNPPKTPCWISEP